LRYLFLSFFLSLSLSSFDWLVNIKSFVESCLSECVSLCWLIDWSIDQTDMFYVIW
jgi:hypothetical protein